MTIANAAVLLARLAASGSRERVSAFAPAAAAAAVVIRGGGGGRGASFLVVGDAERPDRDRERERERERDQLRFLPPPPLLALLLPRPPICLLLCFGFLPGFGKEEEVEVDEKKEVQRRRRPPCEKMKEMPARLCHAQLLFYDLERPRGGHQVQTYPPISAKASSRY